MWFEFKSMFIIQIDILTGFNFITLLHNILKLLAASCESIKMAMLVKQKSEENFFWQISWKILLATEWIRAMENVVWVLNKKQRK